ASAADRAYHSRQLREPGGTGLRLEGHAIRTPRGGTPVRGPLGCVGYGGSDGRPDPELGPHPARADAQGPVPLARVAGARALRRGGGGGRPARLRAVRGVRGVPRVRARLPHRARSVGWRVRAGAPADPQAAPRWSPRAPGPHPPLSEVAPATCP